MADSAEKYRRRVRKTLAKFMDRLDTDPIFRANLEAKAMASERPVKRVKKDEVPSEYCAQKNLVNWLRRKKVMVWAVPNQQLLASGVAKNVLYRILGALKASGMRKGAPDLIIGNLSVNGRPVAVELKRKTGSRLSDDQIIFHAELIQHGWEVVVSYGFEDGKKKLKKVLGLK